LIEKNEIINSFKNIFNKITKNNKILDTFSLVNKNNIPSPIYNIIKTILKNYNNKNRFVEYNDFINMTFILFDNFQYYTIKDIFSLILLILIICIYIYF